MLEATDVIQLFLHELVRLISSPHTVYLEAFALREKCGGKGRHKVDHYTHAHCTLWIRGRVGMLQIKK